MLCRMCSLNMTAERVAWLQGTRLNHILGEHYAYVTAEADKDSGFFGYHMVGDPTVVRRCFRMLSGRMSHWLVNGTCSSLQCTVGVPGVHGGDCLCVY